MYTCARCGEDAINDLFDGEGLDENGDECPGDDRPQGYCRNCEDFRPVAE